MDELAQAYPDEAWLQPIVDPDEPDPEPWWGIYFEAWEVLRFDRFYGAMGGQGPISYQAISLYARDMGISGDDFRLFCSTLRQVDAEWLDYAAEKDKAEADGRNK